MHRLLLGFPELEIGLYREFQLDRIVRRLDQILLGPEVPLGSLNRSVAQEQLDLLKFAARCPTQLCARPSKIMRRDSGNANCLGILLQHLPDDLLAEKVAGNAVAA